MALGDTIAAHRRLCLLRLLAAAHQYRSPDALLQGGLDAFGLGATRDQVRGLLAWLAEQGLVALTSPQDGVIVAQLTERGLDVAEGRITAPGVQRPSPGGLARSALRAAAGLPPEAEL